MRRNKQAEKRERGGGGSANGGYKALDKDHLPDLHLRRFQPKPVRASARLCGGGRAGVIAGRGERAATANWKFAAMKKVINEGKEAGGRCKLHRPPPAPGSTRMLPLGKHPTHHLKNKKKKRERKVVNLLEATPRPLLGCSTQQ